MLDRSGQLDRLFQALADPTRRALLEHLSIKAASMSDLAEHLAISLPAVSQHLQILEASGLVGSLKVGRVRSCRLEPKALVPVERWLKQRRTSWDRRFGRLKHLERPARGRAGRR